MGLDFFCVVCYNVGIMDTNNPPYGSVSRLSLMFSLFSTHSFPQITSSFLKSRGFSGSDASHTISALKFLGIIDNEGNKTEKMSKLQLKGEQYSQAVLEILKDSYAKMFEAVKEPNNLSKDDLYNDFISIYGLSGRLATTAVPNFLWLCKEAGLQTAENFEVKIRKPRSRNPEAILTHSKKTETARESLVNRAAYDKSSVEFGEFKLILPQDWDSNKTRQAIVTGEFKGVYDELTKLSTKLKRSIEEIRV